MCEDDYWIYDWRSIPITIQFLGHYLNCNRFHILNPLNLWDSDRMGQLTWTVANPSAGSGNYGANFSIQNSWKLFPCSSDPFRESTWNRLECAFDCNADPLLKKLSFHWIIHPGGNLKLRLRNWRFDQVSWTVANPSGENRKLGALCSAWNLFKSFKSRIFIENIFCQV